MGEPVYDWERIERSPEFQELVRKRRSFVVPATIFFLCYYMGFILLCGYAKDFMASSVYEGLTVGYCLALTQFVMVFVLGIMYLRKADRDYDPLARKVVEMAEGGELAADGARFEREPAATPEVHAMRLFAAINVEAVVIFAIVLSITLGITYWASKRATSAVGFYAAGRQITGAQNGLAISGDYLSAASFLGIAGLIFLYGFDGFLYSIGFLVAFLTVMFLLAERMRNAGKFTIADVLAFRLRERPARTAAAIGTLAVVAFYLIAQMVGAGVLIQALVGIDFTPAVILTGLFMLCYVVFGGMVATTWVQIIKAVLLMTGITVMSIFVLGKVGFNPIELFNRADANKGPESTFSLGPGTFLPKPIDTVSLGLALVLGTAGLPHILMRFFTVPNAKAARSSVVWAMFLIGFFYLLTTFIGFGARAFLGEGGVEAAGTGGNLAAPNLAAVPGRRRGHLRRRPVPGRDRRHRVRDDPRRGGGPGAVGVGGGVARRLVEHHPQGQGVRARGGGRRQDRGDLDRPHRHHRRRDRRLRPERVVHGRPRLRGGGQRQLPGAAAGAHLAALQHRGRRHRRAVRRDQLDRAGHRLAEGVAGRGHRHRLADRLGAVEPGHRLDPARLPRLLAGDDAELGARQRAHLPRALRPFGDRPRLREGRALVEPLDRIRGTTWGRRPDGRRPLTS